MSAKNHLHKAEGRERRATRRIKVFVPTEIIVDDMPARAHLLDISSTGSRIHTSTTTQTGDSAKLRLNGEAHKVRVVWSDDRQAGIQFDTQLTSDQVARVFLR